MKQTRRHSRLALSAREVQQLVDSFLKLPDSTTRSRLRPTHKAGELLPGLLEKYKIGVFRPEEQLLGEWESMVGQTLASLCQPIRLESNDTILVLAVANPVVRQELTFQKTALLRKIRQSPGLQKLRDLRFQYLG